MAKSTSFFGSIAVRVAETITGRSLSFQDLWGSDAISLGVGNASGEPVNSITAMQASAVWGSVRIIAEGISTLPADTFQRIEVDGTAGKVTIRKPYRPRPSWLDTPNVGLRLGRLDLLSQTLISLLLRGNAYWATTRDGLGNVVAISVLSPDAVQPEVSSGTATDVVPRGFIQYRVSGKLYGPMEVYHLRGMTMPGELKGLDPIAAHAHTIGTTLAATKYGAGFFAKGALPTAVIEVPQPMSEAGIRNLRKAWDAIHGGVGNSGKVGVLTEGASLKAVSLTPEQSQFLATRQFAVSDIARIFGVPPHLLADASGSTSWGSGLAEQNVAFVQHTLRPWVERIETAYTWLLVSEGKASTAFIKLNVEGLQRGSYAQRLDAYAVAESIGLYTLDEMRAMEDLAPLTPEQLAQMKDLRASKAPPTPTAPQDPNAAPPPDKGTTPAPPPPPPPGGKK